MVRTLAVESSKRINEKVLLKGWVSTVRDHGKIVFIDLIDRTGEVQLVCNNLSKIPSVQSVIEVVGVVRKRPKEMINKKIPTGEVEVEVGGLKIIEKASKMPFDMGGEDLNVSLETLLDYRPLTLRHPKVKAIFKVQEVIVSAFRDALKSLGFTEIFVPTLVPTATEGGAEVFPVTYYDRQVYLGQSPQLYKQIMVGVFERVFTVAHAYRAEPSVTTRHITEYISLDCEFGFIDTFEDVMDIAEIVIKKIFREVSEKCKFELSLYGASVPKVSKKIPRIRMRDAQKRILEITGRDSTGENDLTPQDERDICEWAKEKYGSELIFITHYPTKKRPFYTYPDPEDPEFTHSFDLLGRGMEWITGGRRITSYNKILENIERWGNKPSDFKIYLQAFRYGMPPEGGFAIGVERVTMKILGLSNIREASLFPRDMKRVDISLK